MIINPVKYEYIELSSELEKYVYEHINENECKELLFKGYIKLALQIASNFTVIGYDKEDIESEAFVGLWIAVLKFNPELNIKFCTFAYRCIKTRLLNLLRKRNLDTTSLDASISEGEDEICLHDIIDGTVIDYLFKEETDLIKDACDKALNKEDKELVYLYYHKGLTVRQLGVMNNTNSTGISRKLKKAREKIVLYITTGKVIDKISNTMMVNAMDKFKEMMGED